MKNCQAKTKTGASCRAPASEGGLCFFHANPESAKKLGQMGGRKNRRPVVELQVPCNLTAADVCNVSGEAIRLLLSGQLKARDATAMAQLCNSLYRGIPAADLEARVTTLEKQIANGKNEILATEDATEILTDAELTENHPHEYERQMNGEELEEVKHETNTAEDWRSGVERQEGGQEAVEAEESTFLSTDGNAGITGGGRDEVENAAGANDGLEDAEASES